MCDGTNCAANLTAWLAIYLDGFPFVRFGVKVRLNHQAFHLLRGPRRAGASLSQGWLHLRAHRSRVFSHRRHSNKRLLSPKAAGFCPALLCHLPNSWLQYQTDTLVPCLKTLLKRTTHPSPPPDPRSALAVVLPPAVSRRTPDRA